MRILKKLFAPKEVRITLCILEELDYKYNTPVFKKLRDEFERNILTEPNKYKELIPKQDSLRIFVLKILYNRAISYLSSGDYHCYRGMLTPTGGGEELLHIVNDIIEELVKMESMTAEAAEEVREQLRENIKENG